MMLDRLHHRKQCVLRQQVVVVQEGDVLTSRECEGTVRRCADVTIGSPEDDFDAHIAFRFLLQDGTDVRVVDASSAMHNSQ